MHLFKVVMLHESDMDEETKEGFKLLVNSKYSLWAKESAEQSRTEIEAYGQKLYSRFAR